MKSKIVSLSLASMLLISCASSSDIFPTVPTDVGDINSGAVDNGLPNPIAIAADPANNQIIVVNSNVDYYYDQGSLMTISVDTTTPTDPILQVTSVVATPSFGRK